MKTDINFGGNAKIFVQRSNQAFFIFLEIWSGGHSHLHTYSKYSLRYNNKIL